MSITMPQSHLYIFTEEQRNYNFTDEVLTEEMMNFFESIKSIIDKEFKIELKPLTFIEVLKGFGMLLLILAFLILMVCSLMIGLFIGIIIRACKMTFNLFAAIGSKLFKK